MRRDDATRLLRTMLDANGLTDWHLRVSTNDKVMKYLALCSYSDKTIYLNGLHLDAHPDSEIEDTFRHEIAHALTPGHAHDDVWKAKAKELGIENPKECGSYSLPISLINAIRSGGVIEVEWEDKTIIKQVTETVKVPRITQKKLVDLCTVCGKPAHEIKSYEFNDKRFISLECGHLLIKDLPKKINYSTIVRNSWKPEIANCKHEWEKNNCIRCGEYKLFPYQVVGAEAVERANFRFGIFDDPGLGKTLQAVVPIVTHPEITCPCLVVCKSSLKYQIAREFIMWGGYAFLPQIINTGRDAILKGFKVYIVSYDMLRRMQPKDLLAVGIKCMIIDECQQIKNPSSTRTGEVRRLIKDGNIEMVLPLSGTPWKNHGEEFYVALNAIAPKLFWNFEAYKKEWVNYYWEGSKLRKGGIRNVPRFRELTKHILIRREQKDVLPDLPILNRTKLYCEMPNEVIETYEDAESDFVRIWNQLVLGGEEESFQANQTLAGAIMRLRHIVGQAKVPATVDYALEFLENTDRKITIFVHHQDVGRAIAMALREAIEANNAADEPDFEPCNIPLTFTSDLSPAHRDQLVDKFKADPKNRVLVASTLAAGEGLNLQFCSDLVMHERQWNPPNEEQAERRFIRAVGGTSSVVNAIYTEAPGTVDEHLDGIVSRKRRAFHDGMNRGEMVSWNQNSIIKEMGEILSRKYKDRKNGKVAKK